MLENEVIFFNWIINLKVIENEDKWLIYEEEETDV